MAAYTRVLNELTRYIHHIYSVYMATTKILFATDSKIKDRAKKRAAKEGTTLTAVLDRALGLYSENLFDPEDFLSKSDIEGIKLARAQVDRGEVYTLEEVKAHLARDRKKA